MVMSRLRGVVSAYLRSLNVLAENVRAAVKGRTVPCKCEWCRPSGCRCIDCTWQRDLLNQLDADVREVRADVDRILDTGQGF